jgi:hypothetical protein
MGSHKQLVEPVSVGMAAPPFHTALDQLKFVHQINVIFVQWVLRVSHLATSLGISNQFVVVHVSNLPAIIIHIDCWLSHLFRFLGEFKIEIQRSRSPKRLRVRRGQV